MSEPIDVAFIPKQRAVYSDTYANLPTTGLTDGDLAYATDRKVFYRWNGASWASLTIYSGFGTAGTIPTANTLPNGSLYFETDTGYLKQVQTGAWAALSGSTSKVKTGTYTGDSTNSRQITTGFQCRFVRIQGGKYIVTGAAGGCTLTPVTYGLYYNNSAGAVSADAGLICHATDGFIVGKAAGTNYEFNATGELYTYVAFGL